jgi:hypothetical protein
MSALAGLVPPVSDIDEILIPVRGVAICVVPSKGINVFN